MKKNALSSWSLYNRKEEVNLRKTNILCLKERGWAKYLLKETQEGKST